MNFPKPLISDFQLERTSSPQRFVLFGLALACGYVALHHISTTNTAQPPAAPQVARALDPESVWQKVGMHDTYAYSQ
jgi:hypothetical protein